jgi:type II secretory ATPase GspE/PulE/Tfp pilus assembly ATPase PilB-like protein
MLTSTVTAQNHIDTQFQLDADYRARFQNIANKIHAAPDLDRILVHLIPEITSLFEADRLTIYIVDGFRRELTSRFKSGDEIAEIRIPIGTDSISGFAAYKKQLVNVQNVYDPKVLAAIDADLRFDGSWDKKSGYNTRQVLAVPVIFRKFLLGVIQLINRGDNQAFTKTDEQSVRELARVLGIALYNQKKMSRGRATRFDYLLKNSLLTPKELDKAIAEARRTRVALESVLIKIFKIPKKDVGKALAVFYGVPYIQFSPTTSIPGELLVGLKVPFLRKNFWVPIRTENGKIVIAVDNPHNLQKIDEIKALFPGRRLTFEVALKSDILDFIRMFTHDENELAEIDDILSKLELEAEEIQEAEHGVGEEDSAVVQLVNKIILDACRRNASDIHIEPYPGKQSTRVRTRIDGACAIYQTIPFNYKNAVVSRIKIMADLDIAERRKPQDGKIKFNRYGGKDVELRVATIPTQGGLEDVVLRVLHAGDLKSLARMGFSKTNFRNFTRAISQPYGLIFVCGPTGSGKTTTLHSALGYINKPDVKIWTAEDPVEITQAGLRQVQVRPKIGFDFATALRSFLRADPDVIMVGEMRDAETTAIGIEASLTGHLVLSTLHTNNAPESIIRLLDMGMDPFNFADAILCILAQRLVRTLCPDCKKTYHPDRIQFEELVREYGSAQYNRRLNIKYDERLKLNKPTGCVRCNQTGYRGRMAIHELLLGSDEMKRLIQSKAEMELIRSQALKDGMTTLKQDGIAKIFAGYCDLTEVRRVCIR